MVWIGSENLQHHMLIPKHNLQKDLKDLIIKIFDGSTIPVWINRINLVECLCEM